MTTQYAMSPKTGFTAEPVDGVEGVERLPWKESLLSAALVLNPALLDVEGHIAIGLDGGSTCSSPDLLFVDEMGRLTIVELKNETAKTGALAQLLGYGFAWGLVPNGEADRCVRKLTREDMAERFVVREVQHLAKVLDIPEAKFPKMIDAAFARLRPVWPWANQKATGLRDAATEIFGDHALSLAGVPPRLVLIAPGFDDACVQLAAELAGRQVNVQLVRASLGQGAKQANIVLEWEVIQEQELLDRCWAATRAAWKRSYIREHFTVNAWSDREASDCVSLASVVAPDARVWIAAKGRGEIVVSSRVPHGWHSKTALRRRITAAFTDAIDGVLGSDGFGDYSHKFKPRADLAKVASCVETVARALLEHVVPHQVADDD
jgi:hypothetical protein